MLLCSDDNLIILLVFKIIFISYFDVRHQLAISSYVKWEQVKQLTQRIVVIIQVLITVSDTREVFKQALLLVCGVESVVSGASSLDSTSSPVRLARSP